MLAGLDVPGTHAPSSRLTRRTGSNPLFVLETVRHLIEAGHLEEGLPERMLPPGKVGSIIRRRLERLSPTALRVAQAAAVLQSDFDPALVGELLDMGAVALIEPWDELEKAQLLKLNRFAHDLVYETVRQDISPSMATLLHRRAAEVLTVRHANPLRVAEHWLKAEDEERALSILLTATELATADHRLADADALYLRAAEVLRMRGDNEALTHILAAREKLSLGLS